MCIRDRVMRKKDKKRLMIAGGAVSLIFLMTVVVVALVGGKEDTPSMEIPGLEEFGEEVVDFQTENVMINDQETVYWDIGRPGNTTDNVLVTGVQVLIVWSDDERAPSTRPLYTNTPDTFILSVIGVPVLGRSPSADGNNTNGTVEGGELRISSTSQMGSTRVTLECMNNPILLEQKGNGTGTDFEWDPAGNSEPGNTGLFINVTCMAGHIESSRPALLRYTDQGDEITMSIALSYKIVPDEVLESWLSTNSRS
jgi:hypothetical protein